MKKNIRHLSAKADLAGTLRTTSLEILPKTNDRWLNGHCRTLEGWGGNCDFTILIDFDVTLNYVAKYGTKKEENSAGFQSVFHTALRKGIQNESEVKTVLRSVFLTAEKTQQETAHLIMGLPLVRCSEQFLHVSLYNNMQQISVAVQCDGDAQQLQPDGDEDDEENDGNNNNNSTIAKKVQFTLVDAYSKRMDRTMLHRDLQHEKQVWYT